MRIEDEIKQPKFRDAYQRLVVNLLFTSNWLEGRQHDFFKPFGITTQQFNILRILRGQHPNQISGVEIKTRMLDRNSDISRLLDRLLKKELINKSQSENDKRAANVSITQKGLDLLSRIDEKFQEVERNHFNLTEAEATQLSQLLDKARG
ncbi:MAG TPA: MarR family transcriptional regulator [Cyclobacteriaceae bacterium]|nr:MarR family transcriptional regulator [Cyclobacteriaceae bacterium]